MSVFGTSLARKEVFVHIMINMWYQFSGADLFFGKKKDICFYFLKIDGVGTTAINLCLYSDD